MQRSFKDCLPFFLGFGFLTFLVSNHCFFWDTLVQAARYAHFFVDTRFSTLILPTEIDAGHPPFFGLYLAVQWFVFGKSFAISHLAMLPLLFGIVWQVNRLATYFVAPHFRWLVLLLILSNTVLLGQASLVSPDIALVFFFLLGLNGIYYRVNWQLTVAALGVGLVSMRGLVLLLALGIIAYGVQCMEDQRSASIMNRLRPLFPALLAVAAWYTFHHYETGWCFSTPSESWETQRQMVGFTGFFRNIGILVWRLVDLGMIGWWLLLIWLFYRNYKNGWVSAL